MLYDERLKYYCFKKTKADVQKPHWSLMGWVVKIL